MQVKIKNRPTNNDILTAEKEGILIVTFVRMTRSHRRNNRQIKSVRKFGKLKSSSNHIIYATRSYQECQLLIDKIRSMYELTKNFSEDWIAPGFIRR